MSKNLGSCQCSDPGCPVHKGSENCENIATHVMYRIDMADETGTPMCDDCANDAFESGLFESDENE